MTRLVVLCAFLFLVAEPAAASTWTVTKTADTLDGACDADCSLREAITAANAEAGPDTVLVPAGTYTLTRAGRSEDANATGDLDVTGPSTTITGAGAIVQAGPSRAEGIDRVLHVAALNTVVRGMTLRHGRHLPSTVGRGAGIAIERDAGLELTEAAVLDNDAADGGGHAGGGISASGSLRATDVTVAGNRTGGFGGGGVWLAGDGDGEVVLSRVAISGNVAAGSDVMGGGMRINGRHAVTLTNVTISANTLAAATGGSGGGNGGAIAHHEGTLTMRFTTIADNAATVPGGGGTGGIYAGIDATVGTTILARNTRNGTPSNCAGTAFTSSGGNVEDGSSCAAFVDAADRNASLALGPLQDNGGPTATHALGAASAAIDRAGPTCPFAPTDQRGAVRPNGGGCDSGAYEVAPVLQPELTVTLTDAPDPVAAGEPITYTARVVNVGGRDANGVALTWTLPSGDTVDVDLGTVVAGAAARVSTHRYVPLSAGTKTATVKVSTPGFGGAQAQTSTTVTAPPAPVNTALPQISPLDPSVGSLLTCAPGSWTGAPQSYRFTWWRAGTEIASGPQYTPPVGDAGADIVCRVVAGNSGGDSAPADSAPVRIQLPPRPLGIGRPAVTPGSATVGAELSCTPGVWNPLPDSYRFAWRRGSEDVGMGNRYTVVRADAGGELVCRVWGTNAGGEGEPLDSLPVPVAAPPADVPVDQLPTPTPFAAPAPAPDLRVSLRAAQEREDGYTSQTVTATVTNVGTADSAPGTLTITIPTGVDADVRGLSYYGCAGPEPGPIVCEIGPTAPGTAAPSFVVSVHARASGQYTFRAQVGNVVVTSTAALNRMIDLPGGGNRPAVELPSGSSGASGTPPSIAPTGAEPGTELTCDTGTELLPEFSYVWTRDLQPISGETSSRYTVVRADVLHRIGCTVAGWRQFQAQTGTLGMRTLMQLVQYDARPVVPTAAMPAAVVFGSTPLEATGSSAPVPMYCPLAAGGCSGEITIVLGRRPALRAKPTPPERLGQTKLRIKAGRNLKVRVKLTAHARKLLRASPSLPVNVKVTSTSRGKKRTKTARTYLRM